MPQRNLIAADAVFRALIDSAPDGIVVINPRTFKGPTS